MYLMQRQLRGAACILLVFSLSILPVQADFNDDVGYTQLESELGSGVPDGAGVPVSEVEASVPVDGDSAWMPDSTDSEFSGKVIADMSGAVAGVYSGHATSIGKRLYGNATSTSPGISNISAYLADHWIGTGFLHLNFGGWPVYQPNFSTSRVSNHSWIGSTGSFNEDALTRLDWVIETDEVIQTVGFTGSSSNALLSSAYNVIAVNQTGAPTDSGSVSAGGAYTAGRTKPEIVAPDGSTSAATPRVGSAAALLIEVANSNPALSTDPAGISTTNRSGNTIYNAERAEVIKAALMTGADRETSNSTSTDITDYRVAAADQTVNGLDRRFGAGQLNIYNSYHIIAAGEQNSIEDYGAGAGLIELTGFDYDPKFGGSQSSNDTATYYFSQTSGPSQLTASLVWNISIDGGSQFNFDGTATLYDLDLLLFDVTDQDNWILVGSSESTTENTENLWQLLDNGKNYALQVERGAAQSAFSWDYGVAWRTVPYTPLEVNPIVLPNGERNEVYPQQTLTASNGELPYTWSIVSYSGALQPDLTLSTDGIISGTPTEIGTTYFTVQVTDGATDTATLDLQITVTQTSGMVCTNCHGDSSF